VLLMEAEGSRTIVRYGVRPSFPPPWRIGVIIRWLFESDSNATLFGEYFHRVMSRTRWEKAPKWLRIIHEGLVSLLLPEPRNNGQPAPTVQPLHPKCMF
jgi:hypothetical protein